MIEDAFGRIGEILNRANVGVKDVADLIRAETPADMYHAVVSSSFDADRLDYLVRDRYMTGTGAGAIDIEWLMDNVRSSRRSTFLLRMPMAASRFVNIVFALDIKRAAEDFLLARYRLYTNVYFHRTTRGIEQFMSAFFRLIARAVTSDGKVAGLSPRSSARSLLFARRRLCRKLSCVG